MVTLSCSGGSPSGASCVFNPISGTPSFSSVLTISTQPLTPTGSYNITITGRAGDLGFGETRLTQVALVVNPGRIGGVTVPIDKLGLVATYVGLASMILLGTAFAMYRRRVNARREIITRL